MSRIFSTFSKISGVSLGMTSNAFRLSTICSGLDAPRMTVLVLGLTASHASARCCTLHPSSDECRGGESGGGRCHRRKCDGHQYENVPQRTAANEREENWNPHRSPLSYLSQPVRSIASPSRSPSGLPPLEASPAASSWTSRGRQSGSPRGSRRCTVALHRQAEPHRTRACTASTQHAGKRTKPLGR